MKTKKRRSTSCSNCGASLDDSYNYCPQCGKSNTNNNVTFSTLVSEFIDNYFGVDSKLAHSLIPFIFHPGQLTNRFDEGKIKHFIHPIRLYFVMSVVYFFTISYLLNDFNINTIESSAQETNVSLQDLKNDDKLSALNDSVKQRLVENNLNTNFNAKDFNALLDSVTKNYDDEFLNDQSIDLTAVDVPGLTNSLSWSERMHRNARDPFLTDEMFWDSLFQDKIKQENLGSYKLRVMTQTRKIFSNDQGFKNFVLGNLPIMMFILIPLFALILKAIYVRRKHLYVKHVVHAMHVHSFSYLMYALGLLVMFKIIQPSLFPSIDIEQARIITGISFFVLTSTYTYFSFKRVYKQGWFKTLIKFWMVGFVYAILLQVFFYAEVFISFWYY